MISWKQAGGQKIPEPVKGLDEQFDACNAEVNEAKESLDHYLQQVKLEVSKDAKYCFASKKFRYEIELPSKQTVDEDEFVVTSRVKDKTRYQTDQLRDLITVLEDKEELLKQALAPFLRGVFARFY